MSDRLAEIKARSKPKLVVALDQPDIYWLIAKVEQLRAEVDRAWQAALAQGVEDTRLRNAMHKHADALRDEAVQPQRVAAAEQETRHE